MKKLNLAYYHYYNRQYGWIGHFWQDRYKSKPVGKDNYFIQFWGSVLQAKNEQNKIDYCLNKTIIRKQQ